MTSDDPAALVAAIRAKHQRIGEVCRYCAEPLGGPCDAARAADMIERLNQDVEFMAAAHQADERNWVEMYARADRAEAREAGLRAVIANMLTGEGI